MLATDAHTRAISARKNLMSDHQCFHLQILASQINSSVSSMLARVQPQCRTTTLYEPHLIEDVGNANKILIFPIQKLNKRKPHF